MQSQQAKPAITHSPLNVPTIPDRPRLKDYLATMKPETWGSTKVDENIYRPSPISNTNNINNVYYHSMPGSNHLPVNILKENEPIFNSQQLSMPYAPPTSLVQPMPFAYQPSMYSQPHSNFVPPPVMHYNPPPAQPYSMYPPSTTPSIPMHQSTLQNPSIYQYPNTSDTNHPRLPLPVKFDPYRPQPVGAYDIPLTQPPVLLNPQDVYRPGGLSGMTQRPMTNPNYDPNQYIQYMAPSTASVASSFSNLSINPMSNH